MHLVLSTVFFIFFVGSVSTGIVFSRNSDGSFSAKPKSLDIGNRGQAINSGDESSVGKLNSNFKRENHIVKTPLGDDDLGLVHEYFQERTINKTGQLRYSTLAVVEKALIKEIVRLVMKNEEYMLLLNNPSFSDVVHMAESMIREPIQDVLQKQISSKFLAVQAYYNKFYKPLNNPATKKEALEFLKHLKTASINKELTVNDTVKLNSEVRTLAFLVQEDQFNKEINELESIFNDRKDEQKKTRNDTVISFGSAIRRSVNRTIRDAKIVNLPSSSFAAENSATSRSALIDSSIIQPRKTNSPDGNSAISYFKTTTTDPSSSTVQTVNSEKITTGRISADKSESSVQDETTSNLPIKSIFATDLDLIKTRIVNAINVSSIPAVANSIKKITLNPIVTRLNEIDNKGGQSVY